MLKEPSMKDIHYNRKSGHYSEVKRQKKLTGYS